MRRWTTAPPAYDYFYTTRTGRSVVRYGHTYHEIETTDPERFEAFQIPRYASGLHATFTAADLEIEEPAQ